MIRKAEEQPAAPVAPAPKTTSDAPERETAPVVPVPKSPPTRVPESAPVVPERTPALIAPKPAERPIVGVLALQGDFAAHGNALAELGALVREVRVPRDFDGLEGLVLPGGESTALLRLLRPEKMDSALREFHARGGVLFGTCAGLILLATRVVAPEQESMGLIDVTVERNAYGRQVDSFIADGRLFLSDGGRGPGDPTEMVFIRAPRIRKVGPGVRILGRLGEEPVLILKDRILAGTWHPEMSRDRRVHAFLLDLIRHPDP